MKNGFFQSLPELGAVGGRVCQCGTIDEASRFSKAIDKRIIIHIRDKNAVIAGFQTNVVFYLKDKKS